MKHLSLCKWTEKTKYNTNTPIKLFCPNFPSIRKIGNSILFTIILLGFTQVCSGQTVITYYKSNGTSVTWSSATYWLSSASIDGPYVQASSAPGINCDVVIQSKHTVSLNSDASVNNITILSGGTLKPGSRTLNVYGNFINDGTFTSGTSSVAMVGSLAQNIRGNTNTQFNNLIINNASSSGVTASTNFSIGIAFTINSSCIFNPDPTVIVTGQPSSTIGGDGAVMVTGTIPGLYGNYASQYVSFSNNSVKTIQYVGSNEQVVSQGSAIKNILINNLNGCILKGTAILSENLNILSGKLFIKPGASLTVSGTTTLNSAGCLVLQSDSTEADGELTGSFLHSDLFSGEGTVKVQRFMSHTRNWHIYCSPIGYTSVANHNQVSIHDFLLNNLEIPDLLNSSGSVIGVGMRDYSTAEDKWNSYYVYENKPSTKPDETMEIGKGFSIRTSKYEVGSTGTLGTGSIDAIGIPNLNTVNITLSSTTIPATSTTLSKVNGWNCIGNPFTSAINVPDFLAFTDPEASIDNLASLDPHFAAIYVWDTNGLTNTGPVFSSAGEYIALNSSGGDVDVSSIQIGQGFFVKPKSNGAKVQFNSQMQSPDPSLTFKSAKPNWPTIVLRVQSPTLSLLSSTRIKFIPNMTKGLDPGYDAGMLKANPDFALYSKLLVDNAVDFTIQCLPDQDYDKYVIPLGIDCKVAGDVTFTAETVNLPSGCQALLEDRLTKRFTRLDLKDAKYTAAISADTKGTGRFFLHTSDVISSTQPIENQLFKVYETGKTVYINGEVSENAKFFIYSVNGKQLANFNATSLVMNQFDASGLPAGVYILSINDKNQSKSVKFVIEN